MDVTRYPHYENVVSNILAFFIDDSEEHGMGSLWFDSLLSLKRIDANESNITVRREYYTNKGNRIDLLIESDNYAVCIENGVFLKNKDDKFHLHAFMNITNPRKDYFIYSCKGIQEALWTMSPDWSDTV